MVLESLVDPASAKRNPWKLVLLAFVFVSIAVFATLFLGSKESSLLLVLFVIIPSIPTIHKLFSFEEESFEKVPFRVAGSRTLARHLPTLMVLANYFLGLTLAFTFWYLALPSPEAESLFSAQISELEAVRAHFQGFAVNAEASINAGAFELLFFHNLEVLLIVMVLSVVYSTGALFVLIWNASVIAVFLGALARNLVDPSAAALSMGAGILGILPHGVFELLAYLTTALSGGILSRAIVRQAYKKPLFRQIVYDVAKLFAWAVVFLAIGALIESTGVP
ncbi:hypothetical protein COX85_00565 [Candidatus Micrarchaeota archaeon CG_4_10_14_0_2_um_filter_55_9]|nr:MAG: hypothetical protein AUJ15_03345 [Candidatus Micrarchaeota archaeon CG1_02_55_41]PIO03008.1 MAG: hypothetical protein COT57_01240 [Candidatus Micrarchaeota archaeon CG09_land_8_20_14_0_10_55_25]PIZ92051.1 MAG: hypothetical protein COX85_00565 [Candidatus Micrarchaeota archaeon CG_4_10_14_0_2_um_filter_55_9]PJD01431.1 MAG: hypothetical protein COU38_01060 [Candidatus Micrarchaeota archaeon CG10_big_fil_rev_8_21_14_0_10_54_18]